MVDINIDWDDLPEVSNRNHRQFLLNYAGGMGPVESYMEVYGEDMKLTSAKTSASTLLNREDYIKFLNVYSDIKIKKQLESEIEAIAKALDPLELILNLKDTAGTSRYSNPGVSRDINLKLLEMSGTQDIVAKIVRDSLAERGYLPDETARSSGEQFSQGH